MIESYMQRSGWALTVIATLGAGLFSPACSGRVQDSSDCRVDSSCGGLGGASGSMSDAGSPAAAGSGTLAPCENGMKDANESDVDCGGSSKCERCASGYRCTTNVDCATEFCKSNYCAEPTCTDRIKNQDETDIDCGGSCSPCDIGASCLVDEDCSNQSCVDGACDDLADTVDSTADLIDDFEDRDLELTTSPALGTSAGHWFAFGDGTALNTVGIATIERAANSRYGLHVSGGNFTSWGSGFGLDLNDSDREDGKGVYDASSYVGITFWARAEDPTTLNVSFPDIDTDATGKTCTVCDHHFYKALQLSTSWQPFTISFADLVLEPGTLPPPTAFKPSGVVSLLFGVSASQSYDLYFDDLAFLK